MPPPSPPIDLQCHRGRLLDCTHNTHDHLEGCSEFVLKGVSWFGMEEKYALLQGLERVPMRELLDFVSSQGFNALRIPLSVTCVLHDCAANQFGGSVGQINPHVHQLRYLANIDVLVREAGSRGLGVLLDMHRLSAGDRNNPLWHDGSVSEAQLISAWEILAKAHCGSIHLIGADLFNEPYAAAWGHGSASEDWAAAAERIGSAVSRACPRWLLFVEGVSHTTGSGEPAVRGQSEAGHNWASNLEGMRHRPLSGLPAPSKLVLSPHIYGPSVAPQPYFDDKDFPANMEAHWESFFGFVANKGHGCVVVGEWGGWFSGNDAVWQRAFSAYLSRHRIGSFYWALNPTSRDTGGLVLADWKTPNTHKLVMLSTMPATSLPGGGGTGAGGKGGANDAEKHHLPHATDSKHAAAAGGGGGGGGGVEKHAEKHEAVVAAAAAAGGGVEKHEHEKREHEPSGLAKPHEHAAHSGNAALGITAAAAAARAPESPSGASANSTFSSRTSPLS
jgi:endoglucanase